eukprot:7272934-Pyramimonas_sp.AAC.1
MVRGARTHSTTFGEAPAEWVIARARPSGREFHAAPPLSVGRKRPPDSGGEEGGGEPSDEPDP